MTIHLAYQQTLMQLFELYDSSEAANIADWVMEHVTGQRRIDRIMYPELPLNTEQQQRLQQITHQLLLHTPVQYVLGECWFAGMKLFVNPHVLIPRPETEELVEWAGNFIASNTKGEVKLIDIGTGSGCIPIALKKKYPQTNITAIDLSEDALQVARRNATEQQVTLDFRQMDFLDAVNWSQLPVFDIMISNPPYIRQSEAAEMRRNVLDHEPHLALFVPDDDALIFYRNIIRFAADHLQPTGSIFLEINESLANELVTLFEGAGYTTTLRKDMQGKERMLCAQPSPGDLKA